MRNKKNWIYLVVIIVILILLFAWGRSASETKAGFWKDTDVRCLPQGHQSAVTHIHPNLTMIVDGILEEIPPNIGVLPNCMAEVHTHEGGGTVHVETMSISRDITLGDFFEVWDRDLLMDGFTLTASVGEEEIENPREYIMKDRDDIMLLYESENPEEEVEDQI